MYVQIAVFRRCLDRAIEIKLIRGPVAGPFAKPFQGDLDVAGAYFDCVIKIAEFAFVPDLHRALVAAFVLTDAHAFGVVAVGAKGGGSGCPDPFAAALVTALLFLKPFLEGLHQLVEPAQGLDLGLFRVAKMLFSHLLKPLLRDIHGLQHLIGGDPLEAFEAGRKGAVEFVDVAFVLHHGRAGQIVEGVDVIGGKAARHAFKKRQVFAQ